MKKSSPGLCLFHSVWGFTVLLPPGAHTLLLTHRKKKGSCGPLPVWVYVAPGRQAEVLWRLCAGFNLGSRLNTQGMFWGDLQLAAAAFHILLHSCGSATTNTTIDPLSYSLTHTPPPNPPVFLFSLSESVCVPVCVSQAKKYSTKWSQIPWCGMGKYWCINGVLCILWGLAVVLCFYLFSCIF